MVRTIAQFPVFIECVDANLSHTHIHACKFSCSFVFYLSLPDREHVLDPIARFLVFLE
jgi:hypothetical protein